MLVLKTSYDFLWLLKNGVKLSQQCCCFRPGVGSETRENVTKHQIIHSLPLWFLTWNSPQNIHFKTEETITHGGGGVGWQSRLLRQPVSIICYFPRHNEDIYLEVVWMRGQLVNSTLRPAAGQSCSAFPWSTNKSLAKTNDLEKTLRSSPLNSVDITHIESPATDRGHTVTEVKREFLYINMQIALLISISPP